MKILSVSRRTDIPAFYSDWLMKRLEEGLVQYKNPFNQEVYSVNVSPDDVSAIVFWSKNFQPLLKHLVRLEMNYRFYFHFTITGLPKILELSTPPVEKAIETFKILSERYSPYQIQWRFDPIVLTNITPLDYYMEMFDTLSSKLTGYTHRCYFSFVQAYYVKVKRQFSLLEASGNIKFISPSCEEQTRLLDFMKELSEKRNMTLYSCCQSQFVDSNIEKASCVDKLLLERLFPDIDFSVKKTPTRKECGCFKSIDLGAYDTCPHGCLYCYANANQIKAQQFFKHHKSDAVILQ